MQNTAVTMPADSFGKLGLSHHMHVIIPDTINDAIMYAYLIEQCQYHIHAISVSTLVTNYVTYSDRFNCVTPQHFLPSAIFNLIPDPTILLLKRLGSGHVQCYYCIGISLVFRPHPLSRVVYTLLPSIHPSIHLQRTIWVSGFAVKLILSLDRDKNWVKTIVFCDRQTDRQAQQIELYKKNCSCLAKKSLNEK